MYQYFITSYSLFSEIKKATDITIESLATTCITEKERRIYLKFPKNLNFYLFIKEIKVIFHSTEDLGKERAVLLAKRLNTIFKRNVVH